MKISEITDYLERLAPLSYQEDYDNSGLLVGNKNKEISAALISLDCTEDIVEEAIQKGCGLIISHHPIVFRGLKRFNGNSYVERVIIKAIKNDIALYAIHTNFDNVLNGVNSKIAQKIGLQDCRILSPKTALLKKLVTFCPVSHADKVRSALFEAGAGNIGNYSECSFNLDGYGTFKAGEHTNAYVGEKGQLHEEAEVRIETILPVQLEASVIKALLNSHPYEEVAFDVYPLTNSFNNVGSGLIGSLTEEMDELPFLQMVKNNLHTKVIRHTNLMGKKVLKVAVCGGAGGFLLQSAMRQGADVFITADYKYHEFFDADGKIVIADVGHFESEQFTQELLFEIIRKNFANFALHLTGKNTNPINYLF